MAFRPWLRLVLSVCLIASVSFPVTGHAFRGTPGRPDLKPLPDPNDKACADPAWPYYYYRHPVIFQETSHTGDLRFVGFGYADACKQSGKGVRGGTASELAETPGVWKPDILQIWSQLTLVGLNEALPHIGHPGDNAYRWPVPAFPIHGLRYTDFYNETAQTVCRYRPDDLDLICPGLPPDFGQTVLADAGYTRWKDRFNTWRWSPGPGAKATAAWFKSDLSTRPPHPNENFYARHWADDMRINHGDGGLIRVILHPVDLAVHSMPEKTPLDAAQSKAIIPLAIENPSTRHSLKTTIGWRIAGETEWRPVEGWRPQGEEAWRPYSQPIPLGAEAHTDIDVLISGAKDGQIVQLMANEQKAIPEAAIGKPETYDAYANNIGQTRLEDPSLDLAVVSLEVPSSAICQFPGSYQVRWTIRNSSARTVTARRQALRTSGKAEPANLRIGSRSYPPGDTVEEATVAITHCGDTVTIRVEINGDRALAETTYANNALTRSTVVGAEQPRNPSFSGGSSNVIIVPADCQRNPDLSSEYPCLNYPELKIPR